MRKKIIIFAFLISVHFTYGQQTINVSLLQDVRLLLVGDDRGNDAFTLNFLSRVEMPVYRYGNKHIAAYLSLEYADLIVKNYTRYALGAAFDIEGIYKKIGGAISFDLGKIYRRKKGFISFSFGGELNYKLSSKLKLVFLYQFKHRKDLKVLYNAKKEFRLSGFAGVKYSF